MEEKHQSIGLIVTLSVLLLLICAVAGILLFCPEPEEPAMAQLPAQPTEATQEATDATTEATTEPSTGFTVPTVPLSEAAQAVQTFAQANNLNLKDYPDSILKLLERNPETEDFVLNYPLEYGKAHEVDLSEYENCETVPLFMQWDRRWGYLDYGDDVAALNACGPVCLSMVAYYLTGDPGMSPDKIIQFAIDYGYCVPGNGSAWALISEGGAILGLDVWEIRINKDTAISCLEDGDPIICIMGPGDFTTSGHFIVLAGVEDGLIRVNDPNSYARSEKLWDFEDFQGQILDMWALSYSGA